MLERIKLLSELNAINPNDLFSWGVPQKAVAIRRTLRRSIKPKSKVVDARDFCLLKLVPVGIGFNSKECCL